MDIMFKTKKLLKECTNQKLLVRTYGMRRANLIRRRLDELLAANSLYELKFLPGPRCHELKENRAGQFSVDLDHPYRMIFRPTNDPLPKKTDGGFDWKGITAVQILGIEDTHD